MWLELESRNSVLEVAGSNPVRSGRVKIPVVQSDEFTEVLGSEKQHAVYTSQDNFFIASTYI
jgi:hypothetical protein